MSKIDSFRVKIAASLFSTFIKTNWHFSLKMNYVVWFSNKIRWYIRKTVKPVKCYTPFEVEFVRISYSTNSLLCERAIHFLAYTIRLILSFATGLFVCCLLPSYSQTQHRFTFLFRWQHNNNNGKNMLIQICNDLPIDAMGQKVKRMLNHHIFGEMCA